MAYKLQTAPASEPLTTATAKTYLKVDSSADDTLIDAAVVAARTYIERELNQSLINQTWDLWLDHWPRKQKRGRDSWWDGVREGSISGLYETENFVELNKGFISSITHVKYYGTDDTEYTLASSKYFLDDQSVPGRVALNYGEIWPSTTLRPTNAVNVRFVAGFGANSSGIPGPIMQALKILLMHFYENRGEEKKEIPSMIHILLQPYKVFSL